MEENKTTVLEDNIPMEDSIEEAPIKDTEINDNTKLNEEDVSSIMEKITNDNSIQGEEITNQEEIPELRDATRIGNLFSDIDKLPEEMKEEQQEVLVDDVAFVKYDFKRDDNKDTELKVEFKKKDNEEDKFSAALSIKENGKGQRQLSISKEPDNVNKELLFTTFEIVVKILNGTFIPFYTLEEKTPDSEVDSVYQEETEVKDAEIVE